MTLSLRAYLAASLLIVLITGSAVAAALLVPAIERAYTDAHTANLLAQARLAAAALQPGDFADLPATTPAPYSQTTNAQPGVHTRLLSPSGAVLLDTRLLDPSGTVLLDLNAPPNGQPFDLTAAPYLAANASGQVSTTDLLTRPEVQQALAGEPATAVRTLTLPGAPRVAYAAAPVRASDGHVLSLVYLASPLPASGWDALSADARAQIAGALALAALTAALAGLALAQVLSTPVTQLQHAAYAVAHGDLRAHVPATHAVAELAALAHSFNSMTADLRRANEAKTAFVADVSHELRTPLTVIKGTIETLADGALDDLDARDGLLQSMDHETERLIRLVNDLLVLTRADAGALRLETQPVDLHALAAARVRQLAPLAAARGLTLTLTPASDPPPCATADPHRLTQILTNLLDNALRYTRPGDQITLSVRADATHAFYVLADTGPGVAPEHVPHVFARFYRAEPSRSRAHGGSGLGLAITHALVTAHGGRITFESTLGHGTTVTVALPRAN